MTLNMFKLFNLGWWNKIGYMFSNGLQGNHLKLKKNYGFSWFQLVLMLFFHVCTNSPSKLNEEIWTRAQAPRRFQINGWHLVPEEFLVKSITKKTQGSQNSKGYLFLFNVPFYSKTHKQIQYRYGIFQETKTHDPNMFVWYFVWWSTISQENSTGSGFGSQGRTGSPTLAKSRNKAASTTAGAGPDKTAPWVWTSGGLFGAAPWWTSAKINSTNKMFMFDDRFYM